jgi:hypothetical protein
MRSNFVDCAGYYVLHCHILAHEDRGMMTVVEVAPLLTRTRTTSFAFLFTTEGHRGHRVSLLSVTSVPLW